MLECLLESGVRYAEFLRIHDNPDWFDGSFINLPIGSMKKKKSTMKERSIRLNTKGKDMWQMFFSLKIKPPSIQAWNENLKRWAERAGIGADCVSNKMTRKTWESWLMFTYPEKTMLIAMNQGHTTFTALNFYLNVAFTDQDKIDMREFVEGW